MGEPQLKLSYQTLSQVHSLACHEIAARSKTDLQQRREARLQGLQDEVKRVTSQLHAQSTFLTQKSIGPHLSQSGILRPPEVRALLNRVCRELENGL